MHQLFPFIIHIRNIIAHLSIVILFNGCESNYVAVKNDVNEELYSIHEYHPLTLPPDYDELPLPHTDQQIERDHMPADNNLQLEEAYVMDKIPAMVDETPAIIDEKPMPIQSEMPLSQKTEDAMIQESKVTTHSPLAPKTVDKDVELAMGNESQKQHSNPPLKKAKKTKKVKKSNKDVESEQSPKPIVSEPKPSIDESTPNTTVDHRPMEPTMISSYSMDEQELLNQIQ